ncbi:hypothetical protein DP590_17705 [Salmonella enterica]|nr:hypothetical protein [Salmonella enterica]ECE0740237.1 hypothetical protein [Salmonella enterica subsp. enterica serovar Hvittingfoss]MJE82142.1 hypothetical protein [Salmonella enterica]
MTGKYDLKDVERAVLTALPADQYKIKALAKLYHSRCEIEVKFRKIKSNQLDNVLIVWSRKTGLR